MSITYVVGVVFPMNRSYLHFFACVLLCLSALGVSAQEKDKSKLEERPIHYQDIQAMLVFRSRIKKSDKQVANEIAAEIRRRTVEFIITLEEEKALRKIGANDELIDAIRNGIPEEKREHVLKLEEMTRVYVRFTDNYYKKTIPEIRIAIEAGKEFIRLYGDDPEVKEQVDYLRSTIPKLEKMIEIRLQVSN